MVECRGGKGGEGVREESYMETGAGAVQQSTRGCGQNDKSEMDDVNCPLVVIRRFQPIGLHIAPVHGDRPLFVPDFETVLFRLCGVK